VSKCCHHPDRAPWRLETRAEDQDTIEAQSKILIISLPGWLVLPTRLPCAALVVVANADRCLRSSSRQETSGLNGVADPQESKFLEIAFRVPSMKAEQACNVLAERVVSERRPKSCWTQVTYYRLADAPRDYRALAQADEFTHESNNTAAGNRCPTIEIQELDDYERLDEAISHLYGYDWLILGQASMRQLFFKRLTERALTPRVWMS